MGKNEAWLRSPRQAHIDIFATGGVRDSPSFNAQGDVSLFAFPQPYFVAGIAIRKASLAEYRVLKTNFEIMLGARFEQAVLDSSQGFERPGRDFDMRTKLARDSLFQDVPSRQQSAVFVFHSVSPFVQR